MVADVSCALGQSQLVRPESRLGTVVHLQLAEDVGHVVLHRPFRDAQSDGDLFVAHPARQLAQHSNLALGETEVGCYVALA